MRCDIITLFPDMVLPVLGQSMLKRAKEKGLLEVTVHNLRDYTQDRHRVVDDTPYGGGAGMVIRHPCGFSSHPRRDGRSRMS